MTPVMVPYNLRANKLFLAGLVTDHAWAECCQVLLVSTCEHLDE